VPVFFGVQRQFRPQHAGDAYPVPLRREISSLKILIATIIFVLPSIPLSALGGEIADSHNKAFLARRLKFVEIGIQMIAAAGLVFSSLMLPYVAFMSRCLASAASRPCSARSNTGFFRITCDARNWSRAMRWSRARHSRRSSAGSSSAGLRRRKVVPPSASSHS
jgi:hypothetical protein